MYDGVQVVHLTQHITYIFFHVHIVLGSLLVHIPVSSVHGTYVIVQLSHFIEHLISLYIHIAVIKLNYVIICKSINQLNFWNKSAWNSTS